MGVHKTKNYFEGWYLKVTDENNHSFVFIFGISLYKDDPHSFIQVIDSSENKSYYFRFEVSDFYYNRDAIRIKDNILGIHQLKIQIEPFDIDLNIAPTLFLKKGLFSGCIMHFFKYLPLPTYHEIVFLKAKVEGSIKAKNDSYKINGHGYMEKNFGTRFPKTWLWVQANDFEKYNASLILAKAQMFGQFTGFFCLLNVEGEELRFATYNGFKMEHHIKGNDIKITIEKGKVYLIIDVKWTDGAYIIAPVKHGKMEKEIEESLTSTLTISLYRENELIFHDTAINVGCENLYINDEK
jgi:hypothetical protein